MMINRKDDENDDDDELNAKLRICDGETDVSIRLVVR